MSHVVFGVGAERPGEVGKTERLTPRAVTRDQVREMSKERLDDAVVIEEEAFPPDEMASRETMNMRRELAGEFFLEASLKAATVSRGGGGRGRRLGRDLVEGCRSGRCVAWPVSFGFPSLSSVFCGSGPARRCQRRVGQGSRRVAFVEEGGGVKPSRPPFVGIGHRTGYTTGMGPASAGFTRRGSDAPGARPLAPPVPRERETPRT